MKIDSKEKVCTFYASDYHFEMVSLPYINKKLEENEEVIIMTENNLEETMNTLISRMNFKDERKNKILKINWKDDDFNKFKEIKEGVKQNKKLNIFVKGKENYIKNINKNIESWIKENNEIKIIDCYDIEEIAEEMNQIMSSYKRVLSTSGEKEI